MKKGGNTKMQKTFSLKNARKAKSSVVRINSKPTTSSKEDPEIIPGSIKPGKICPPPKEIDILKVKKVFQECRLVDTNELIDTPQAPTDAVDVECLGAELIGLPTCEIDAVNQTVTGTFSFVTAYQFLDANGDPVGDVQIIETLDETRTVFLSRAGEDGLDCQVDVFLECLECFVSATSPDGQILEVTCCVGKQILFKLIAEVQLLVPTFGYAKVPPDCEQVAGQCPDFNPVWPPYPPQTPTYPCRGCGNKNK